MWYGRRPFDEAIVENPSQMRGGGALTRVGNDDEQVVATPCSSFSLVSFLLAFSYPFSLLSIHGR